eukprot:TRINITY_DN7647_c0_g1_i2.p1 TRINITY_DN7647_c0_g1~~TRINITY_DN7647_c0_g1_i2.p1  ORF type:complete len:365 (+),score=42.58 TRINITY_DN7647_c0_g1_i2:53-1096(+)
MPQVLCGPGAVPAIHLAGLNSPYGVAFAQPPVVAQTVPVVCVSVPSVPMTAAGRQLAVTPAVAQPIVSVCNAPVAEAVVEGASPRVAALAVNPRQAVLSDAAAVDGDAAGRGAAGSLRPLRTAVSTPVAALSGAIAQRLRAHNCVEVQAMGPDAVAHSIRALTLCRSYVTRDNIHILSQTEFTHVPARQPSQTQVNHPALRFLARGLSVAKFGPLQPGPYEVPAGAAVLRVDQGSVVAKTAGTLAKLARTVACRGKPVVLVPSATPLCMNTAVKSLTVARAMVAQDGLDIHFQSHFVSTHGERGGEGTVLRVFVSRAPSRAAQEGPTDVEMPAYPVLLNDRDSPDVR